MNTPTLPTLTVKPDDIRGTFGDWAPDAHHYRCTLTYGTRRMTTPFHQGSACKGDPDLLTVLGCLFSDAQAGEDSFEDFCSEFGYETDSRKAEKTWKSCASMNVRLHKLLGADYDLVREYVQGEGY